MGIWRQGCSRSLWVGLAAALLTAATAAAATAQAPPGPGDQQSITLTIPACGSPGNTPPPSDVVQLSSSVVVAGGSVTVLVAGFAPGVTVQLLLLAPPGARPVPLGTATTGAEGELQVVVVLPAGVLPGVFRVEVIGLAPSGACRVARSDPGTAVLGNTSTQPTFVLATSTLPTGGSTTGSGTGCAPGSTVVFTLHSTDVPVGQTTADGQGDFSGVITVPTTATLGRHTVTASCGSLVQTQPLTVVAPAHAQLPFTGDDLRWQVALALLLLLAGAVLLGMDARRRHAPNQGIRLGPKPDPRSR